MLFHGNKKTGNESDSDHGNDGGHGGADLSLQLLGELEVRLDQHELQKETMP